MREDNYIGKATDELYNIFDIINKKCFNNMVQPVLITIMRTKPNILGHFSLNKVWKKVEDKTEVNNEINISAYSLCKGIEEISHIMCHEMCHAFNLQNGIKDCSGQVHNKKFKNTAIGAGLDVERDKRIGYYTIISPSFKSFIENNQEINKNIFELFRDNISKPAPEKPKPKFTYMCGGCNKSFVSKTDDIRAICDECDNEFTLQEK